MKRFILTLLLLAPIAIWAQENINRTVPPPPAPAKSIEIGKTEKFTLPNGLEVIVVRNTKLPRVSASLTVNRDPLLEGNKAGLTSMAGQLLRSGTTTMNKAALDDAIDFLGGNIYTSSTSIGGSALTANFKKLFTIMADITFHPSFPADELEKIRKKELSALAQSKDDPNSIAGNVVSRLLYSANHPYGEIETDSTVKNVTAANIKNYFTIYWKPNISYLVFVGDITKEEAKELAETYFGKWQQADVPKPKYPVPSNPDKPIIAIVDRPVSVQSVINFVQTEPFKPGDADVIPVRVMNNILGGGASSRLFMNLREKHGFTYGAYSAVNPDKLIGSFNAEASVRNEKTDSAVGEFLKEFELMRSTPVSESEVELSKNTLSGAFARSLENPATVANFALNEAIYHLPSDYYQNYLKNIAAVNAGTVMEMAKKYIQPQHMYTVIVGNAKQIVNGLDKYGTIQYYDVEGNTVAAPVTKQADAGVTGKTVIEKAAAAMGNAALKDIKDLEISGTAGAMGQTLQFNQKYLLPDYFEQTLTIQGMLLQKQLTKEGTYSVSAQGQEQPLKDDDKEELAENAAMLPDEYYLSKNGYTFTVKDIEPVEGNDAYSVEIKSPGGRTFTNYYDVKTGLKVKSVTEKDAGPAGKMVIQTYYHDYKPYNGLMVPMKTIVDQGRLKIELDVKDVKINQGLKPTDFK
ncbi:insulinase family protein [Hydrotalea sp.]|uniref:insulinase family protein n=1 Tax=Hydrotalea sp. TaxID=2881279 RepID=UPI0026057F0F|nr:insulinase family protein [Hydrotalea sp.]